MLSEVGLTMHWSTPPPPVPSGVRSGQEQEAGDRRQEAGGGRRRKHLALAPGSQRCRKELTIKQSPKSWVNKLSNNIHYVSLLFA